MGEQAEKVSDEAAIAGTGGLAAHDEYECAHSPYKDAQHFLVGDRLFQIDCSHYHGDDGQRGCNDGGVYGRSHGESEDIDTLIEYQREECGEEYLQHVPVGPPARVCRTRRGARSRRLRLPCGMWLLTTRKTTAKADLPIGAISPHKIFAVRANRCP